MNKPASLSKKKTVITPDDSEQEAEDEYVQKKVQKSDMINEEEENDEDYEDASSDGEDDDDENDEESSMKDEQQTEETKQNNKNVNNKQITISLYDILNVKKDATVEEIKKQFKILALKMHPDKNQGNQEEAKTNFQKINEAYKILIDPEKRKIYDDTGEVEDGNLAEFEKAYNYFRQIYKQVNKEDIDDFEKKYKGSQEEVDDLVQFYNRQKGDIKLILQEIILSNNDDVDRYVNIYEDLIVQGKIKQYQKFDQTKSNIKLLKDESKKVQKMKKKQEKTDLKSLQNMILQKYQKPISGTSFLDSLEQKYGKKTKRNEKEQVAKDSKIKTTVAEERANKGRKKSEKKGKNDDFIVDEDDEDEQEENDEDNNDDQDPNQLSDQAFNKISEKLMKNKQKKQKSQSKKKK